MFFIFVILEISWNRNYKFFSRVQLYELSNFRFQTFFGRHVMNIWKLFRVFACVVNLSLEKKILNTFHRNMVFLQCVFVCGLLNGYYKKNISNTFHRNTSFFQCVFVCVLLKHRFWKNVWYTRHRNTISILRDLPYF